MTKITHYAINTETSTSIPVYDNELYWEDLMHFGPKNQWKFIEAWDGQSELPPVKTRVEIKSVSLHEQGNFFKDWEQATIIYITDCGVVVENRNGKECFLDSLDYGYYFRPVRSEEKDSKINEILNDLNLTSDYRYIAKRMYNLGYHK